MTAILLLFNQSTFRFYKLKTATGNSGKFDCVKISDFTYLSPDKSHLKTGALGLWLKSMNLSFFKF